jgi:hypothetical protein
MKKLLLIIAIILCFVYWENVKGFTQRNLNGAANTIDQGVIYMTQWLVNHTPKNNVK